ncbi:hypothetical protein ACLOJK_000088 [Asimina triloba]
MSKQMGKPPITALFGQQHFKIQESISIAAAYTSSYRRGSSTVGDTGWPTRAAGGSERDVGPDAGWTQTGSGLAAEWGERAVDTGWTQTGSGLATEWGERAVDVGCHHGGHDGHGRPHHATSDRPTCMQRSKAPIQWDVPHPHGASTTSGQYSRRPHPHGINRGKITPIK